MVLPWTETGPSWVLLVVGVEHKYSKLLVICIVVLVTGFAAFGLGAVTQGRAAGSRRSTT
jgi:hypothetical protein